MGEFDELIEEFVTESKEHISDIEDDLIRIESDMENVDPEVINRVFRAAHSIKGSSKFLDLVNIGELSHRMEDVLNLIRSGRMIPSGEVACALLSAADTLKSMLENVTLSNEMDISEPLSELQKLLDNQHEDSTGAGGRTGGPSGDAPLGSFGVPPAEIRERLSASQVYIITVDASKGDMEHIGSELKNLGEVLAQREAPDGSLHVLFATIMEPDMIPLALGISKNEFVQVDESMIDPMRPPCRPRQARSPQTGQAPGRSADAAEALPARREHIPDGDHPEIASDELDAGEMVASLREDIQAARDADNTSFITFTLDNEIYAVPIHTIEEIIGLQEISLLPNVPDFIKGVINLRGEIVPIMDLRLKFKLVPKEYTQFTVFLIMRVEERLMGLVVDNVADVLVIDPSRVQKKPAFSARISTDFIRGVYKDPQDELVILMDVPSLVRMEEWEASRGRAW